MPLITDICLDDYRKKQRFSLNKHMAELGQKQGRIRPYVFKTSSVYSSLIEGSGIDLDSYIRNKDSGFQTREMNQIDDLIEAYQFAKDHTLTYENLLKAHVILSNNLALDEKYKGQLRDVDVFIKRQTMVASETIYTGASPKMITSETKQLLIEASELSKQEKLSYNEAFYYASMLHLVFVKLHPFADGNGRVARLLEKWFLARIYGNVVWGIPSEINYWLKRDKYYTYLDIGKAYPSVKYEYATPFLLMLPSSFGLSKKYYLKD